MNLQLSADNDTKYHIEEVLNKGFTVVRNVLSDHLISQLKELEKFYVNRTHKRFNNSGNLLYNLFKTSDLLYDFPLPELLNIDCIHKISTQIIGEITILDEIVLIFSEPENDKQKLHSDVINYFPSHNITLPPTVICVQIPMVDFDINSGGTRIIPYTQNSFEDIPDLEDEIHFESKIEIPILNIGDCLIRDCRTWHGASVNNSDSRRSMFVLVYKNGKISTKKRVSKDLYFSIDKEKRKIVTI